MTDAPTCAGCVDGYRMIRHSGTGEHHRIRCACQVRDLPVRLVYQAEGAGCVLAAVATIVGKSYREVRHFMSMGTDFSTKGCSIVGPGYELLEQFGYAVQARYRYNQRLNAPRDPWPCAPWADLHLCEVTNLSETGSHAVVLLRDGRVLDPWWGVVDGLHRYSQVGSIAAVFPVQPPALPAVPPSAEATT